MAIIEPNLSNRFLDARTRGQESTLFERVERATQVRYARMADHLPFTKPTRSSPDDAANTAALCGLFDDANRERTARRIADALRPTRKELQICQLRNIARGDADYATRIAKHLGIDASMWN